ncbi:hypothetical protein AB0N88_01920 [Streptomyces sp. NPDC093516]|uniref:hypothetical protein n=1 Tax=unclassified Streptomyces TaxID=2593676 RepID=UPI00343076C8
MRIRSALAVAALTVAVTATGAATAAAGDDDRDHRDGRGHHVACSPYFGELEAETAEIEWGGAVCHNGPFDI